MKWTIPGVPRTAKEKASSFASGSLADVLWKLLVLAVIGAAGFALVLMGPVGAVIGGLLITTLVSEDIRNLVADMWHRRWAEIERPF